VDGKAYGHDAAGNVVERPGSRQSYDAKGRLRSVTADDGTVVSYRYDYSGQRVVKEARGPKGNHRTVYVDRMSEERDGQLVDYVFAGDLRVARLGGARPASIPVLASLRHVPPATGAAAVLLLTFAALASLLRAVRLRPRSLVALGTACAFFSFTTAGCGSCGGSSPAGLAGPAVHYHGDHLGGVALQTDESGGVAAEVAYDPYGAELAASSEPYGFTGKEYDAETGLYDFGARAYDPALGRFLSPDPATLADPELGVSDPQLLNPYAYARNSPTGHVDPQGKLPHIVVGALVGVGIGGGIYLAKAAVTGEFSARGLLGAVGGGAVAGAVAAATGGASLVVQGAAAGLAGGIAQRGVETASLSKTLDPKAMAVDAALGAAAGPALKLAGKGLSAVGERVAPVAKRAIAEAKQFAAGGTRAAAGGAENFFVENGVRRSLAVRETGLSEIPATIYRPGQAPLNTTLRLNQLFSPKTSVPVDARFLRIQPPIHTPIEVQPLGLPGQVPTVPLDQVILVP
jgi:RHS repeat-associated protein